MYTPTFTLTHKMLHYIIKVEQAHLEIKNSPLTPSARKNLYTHMGAENLFNLGKFVGAEVDYKEATKVFNGKTLVSTGTPSVLLSNYRSTCDFIYSASNDKYFSISPSLFLHLNKLLFNGIVDSWDTGRFRDISDTINTKYDRWTNLFDRTGQKMDIQNYFNDILNWYRDIRFFINPLLKIGSVLYELIRVYPFVAGNQVSMVAIAELLLNKSRLTEGGLFSFSRNFVLYEEEYIEALKASRQSGDNQTAWLETFVRNISIDFSSLKNEVSRLAAFKNEKKKEGLIDLNPRQMRLLRYLRLKTKIQRNEYVRIMGVSTMTAFRDVKELIKRKLVISRGGGRSTYYMLAKDEKPLDSTTESIINGQQPDTLNNINKPKVIKVIKDEGFSDEEFQI